MRYAFPRSLGALLVAVAFSMAGAAHAQVRKPNLLIIWGDDICGFHISAYNRGRMGYRTPDIDSIANEGAPFTSWYGQQSCAPGRAAFLTGQSGKNHLGDRRSRTESTNALNPPAPATERSAATPRSEVSSRCAADSALPRQLRMGGAPGRR